MKLNPKVLRYLSKEEFRVLTAVEMGMKNHEVVPTGMIQSIAALKNSSNGSIHHHLSVLARNNLIARVKNASYDGYRLTYGGYDYLALKAFANRGSVVAVGQQLGVGKESDIYIIADQHQHQRVLKLQRLGRTSFRTIKQKRDYLQRRTHASWMYMSRLAAMKEYAFMKVLHEHAFPVPEPLDYNRHCVVMSHVEGYVLNQVDQVDEPGRLYSQLMDLIVRLAQHGLIHGDFNEFNLMLTPDGEPVVIDFPQMVSTSHVNAEFYFNRDVECIRTFFRRRFGYESALYPRFHRVNKSFALDVMVYASGFNKQQKQDMDALADMQLERPGEGHEGDEEDEDLEEEEFSDLSGSEDEPDAAAAAEEQEVEQEEQELLLEGRIQQLQIDQDDTEEDDDVRMNRHRRPFRDSAPAAEDGSDKEAAQEEQEGEDESLAPTYPQEEIRRRVQRDLKQQQKMRFKGNNNKSKGKRGTRAALNSSDGW
jgi:RIO kinase 2